MFQGMIRYDISDFLGAMSVEMSMKNCTVCNQRLTRKGLELTIGDGALSATNPSRLFGFEIGYMCPFHVTQRS